jgi:uncharacterized membrane protein HdeD (DUF308 family)
MSDPTPTSWVLRTTWISLGAALALISLGALAALLPVAAGLAVSILLVWIIVFSGLAHLVHAWDVRGDMFLWRLLVGLVYLCGGLYLVLVLVPDGGYGLVALARFIGAMFVLEAGLLMASAFWMRGRRGSGWLAVDGGVTLLCAALVFVTADWAPPWMLGLLVGLNVISSGLVFLALLRDNKLVARSLAA